MPLPDHPRPSRPDQLVLKELEHLTP